MSSDIEVFRPSLKRIDLENVLNSMMEDSISYGEFAREFQERLASRTNSKHVIALNSYFNAIWLALETLEVGEGDEVILPSFIPQIYLNVIKLKKAVPVLCDIEKDKLAPSIEHIKSLKSEKTKALILFYYFGYFYDASEYIEAVPNVIEDISSILGFDKLENAFNLKGTISIADFSTRSLITTGEGSALFTNNRKVYYKAFSLIEREYTDEGYAPRLSCLMPDLNAAMGITQDKSLNHRLLLKDQIGKIYDESVKKSKGASLIQEEDLKHVYSEYAVIAKSSLKDAVKFFKKYNVEAVRPFAYPLHHYLKFEKKDYPNTEHYYLHTLLLPIHSTLSKKEVELISKIILSLI